MREREREKGTEKETKTDDEVTGSKEKTDKELMSERDAPSILQ